MGSVHPFAVFDPEAAEAMALAFNTAWQSLLVSGSELASSEYAEGTREELALRIIKTAQHGERDATRLCRPRRALLHLSYSCASPFGSAMPVTQDPRRTSAGDVVTPASPFAWTECRAAMRPRGGVTPPTPRRSARGNSGRRSFRWQQ